MSLLDGGTESVTVYPQVTSTDADGNTITKASSTGIATTARIQFQGQSGTSSRRAEQEDEGFSSERVYTIRFPRGFQILGPQSQVVWKGERYSIFGHPQYYTNSRRTSHVSYTIRRS